MCDFFQAEQAAGQWLFILSLRGESDGLLVWFAEERRSLSACVLVQIMIINYMLYERVFKFTFETHLKNKSISYDSQRTWKIIWINLEKCYDNRIKIMGLKMITSTYRQLFGQLWNRNLRIFWQHYIEPELLPCKEPQKEHFSSYTYRTYISWN